jgi:hypothetical protein
MDNIWPQTARSGSKILPEGNMEQISFSLSPIGYLDTVYAPCVARVFDSPIYN